VCRNWPLPPQPSKWNLFPLLKDGSIAKGRCGRAALYSTAQYSTVQYSAGAVQFSLSARPSFSPGVEDYGFRGDRQREKGGERGGEGSQAGGEGSQAGREGSEAEERGHRQRRGVRGREERGHKQEERIHRQRGWRSGEAGATGGAGRGAAGPCSSPRTPGVPSQQLLSQ